MIPTEVLTFGAANLLGGVLTIWSQSLKSRQALFEMRMKELGAVEQSRNDAAMRGGPVTRRIIVVCVLFSVFIAPFVLQILMPEWPLHYAYTEEKGRWLWGLFGPSMEHLKYIEVKGYVILPVHTQMAAAISGYYFGVGAVKG